LQVLCWRTRRAQRSFALCSDARNRLCCRASPNTNTSHKWLPGSVSQPQTRMHGEVRARLHIDRYTLLQLRSCGFCFSSKCGRILVFRSRSGICTRRDEKCWGLWPASEGDGSLRNDPEPRSVAKSKSPTPRLRVGRGGRTDLLLPHAFPDDGRGRWCVAADCSGA
jgi:hypothetical protein